MSNLEKISKQFDYIGSNTYLHESGRVVYTIASTPQSDGTANIIEVNGEPYRTLPVDCSDDMLAIALTGAIVKVGIDG